MLRHQLDAHHRLQCAEEQATGAARRFARDVHAEIQTVDGVDVSVSCWAEDDFVARRGSAVRMGGGIGRIVVRPEIGFHFNDAAGHGSCRCSAEEKLAEKTWRDGLRCDFEEGAGEEFAGEVRRFRGFGIERHFQDRLCIPPALTSEDEAPSFSGGTVWMGHLPIENFWHARTRISKLETIAVQLRRECALSSVHL